MIANKNIRQDINELKKCLVDAELEIPTMWTCIWPGLLFMVWLIVCVFIGVSLSGYFDDSVYSKSNEINVIASFIMAIGVGLLTTFSSASGRSLFLSVPKPFRQRSILYFLLGKKIKFYYFLAMAISLVLCVMCGVLNIPMWGVVFFFLFLLCVFMTIDFGRYQLAAFSNVISAFKESKNA